MRYVCVVTGAVVAVAMIGGVGFVAVEIKDNIVATEKCVSAKRQLSIVHISNGSVAVLGDSYTAGDGLADRKQGWAYKIGSDLAGVGGTGFVNGGSCGNHTYGERLDAVLALNPETLIIQGGLNDSRSSGKVADAAFSVLDRAKNVPNVVLVGPPNVLGRAGEEEVDAGLRAAATAANVEYISALSWDLEYLQDATHLTSTGHADFAANVTSSIRSKAMTRLPA